MALAEVDAKTSEGVEIPVWVISLLGVILVGSDIGVTLNHDADSLAYLELQIDTCTTEWTYLGAIPKIFEVVVVQVFEGLGDVIDLVVAPSDVGATTNECGYIEHTVRVPTAKEVGEVEHEVHTWSYILELIVCRVRIARVLWFKAIPASLALPAIHLQAHAEHWIELVAEAQLNVRGNQVAKLSFAKRVLCTTLKVEESMFLECIFITLLVCIGSSHGRASAQQQCRN